ncbi:hypothetical protein ACH5BF_02105 [Arcobacter sp. YIC-464]|uniref:hypothetical protein n=1 Tax=Arcobacter sp. YIC-464 TaxID=3376631 RepID=UPI003C16CE8A
MKKILMSLMILSTLILANNDTDTLTLKNYIKLFSNLLNINVLVPKDLEDKKISFFINTKLENIEKDLGTLSDVLRANNLILVRKPNYYLVTEKNELSLTCTYEVNNSSFTDIENYFKFQALKYTLFKDTNVVYFKTNKTCKEHIKKLTLIDNVLQNMVLNISIFQNDMSKNNEKEVKFDTKYLQILNPFTVAADTTIKYSRNSYESFLRYVDKNSDVQIKSSPSLKVFNNKALNFNSFQEIPYTKTITQLDKDNSNKTTESTDFKKVGISIKIKPRFLKNGSVYFDMNLSFSNFIDFDKKGIPTTYTNDLNTSFILKEDEMFVLSGLNSQSNKNVLSYPLLSQLPIIGEAFNGYIKENKKFHLSLVVKLTKGVNDVKN